MKPFERLDEAMNRRRLELRMNWRELAEAADISYTALRAIRRGAYRPTELTAQDLDRALQWEPGSVYAILDGRDAIPSGEERVADQAGDAPSHHGTAPPTLEQELELAARLMAAQVRELGLSPDDAAEAWRRATERIRESHEAVSRPDAQPLTERSRRHNAG
jgi:transcriptional regulator with XRE-family HTH domain